MSPIWADRLSPDWCRPPCWGVLAGGPGECGTSGHILKAFQWAEARFKPTLLSLSCWVPHWSLFSQGGGGRGGYPAQR